MSSNEAFSLFILSYEYLTSKANYDHVSYDFTRILIQLDNNKALMYKELQVLAFSHFISCF